MRTIKHSIFIFMAAGMIASCKQQAEKVIVELPALRASSIYNDDSVYVYTNKHKEENKQMADSYFKKGADMEESNPRKAIYYIKRAITLCPSADSYKKLGEVLMRSSMYKEANELYSFLTRKAYIKQADDSYKEMYLFGEPTVDLFHEYILASSLTYNYLNGYPIYDAREAGIDIDLLKKDVLADERFKFDKNSKEYQLFVLQFMNEEQIEAFRSSEENFRSYLSSFRDTAPVFNIDENTVSRFAYDDFNGINYNDDAFDMSGLSAYFLEEMKENPNGWYVYNCNHLIKLNDNVTAVVYAIDTSATACPIDMRHIYHRLVTYNKRGNVIDSKIIAWQAGEQLGTVQFNRNSFLVHEFTRTWKKPYDMREFDNDLVKVEEKNVKAFRISEDGKIEREELLGRE